MMKAGYVVARPGVVEVHREVRLDCAPGGSADDPGRGAGERPAGAMLQDFLWTTRDSWLRRRVVAKAEWTQDEANPRFVVTSLKPKATGARHLYEQIYCARGEMENRVKE